MKPRTAFPHCRRNKIDFVKTFTDHSEEGVQLGPGFRCIEDRRIC
jgi:hypothetical protein